MKAIGRDIRLQEKQAKKRIKNQCGNCKRRSNKRRSRQEIMESNSQALRKRKGGKARCKKKDKARSEKRIMPTR